MTRIDPQHPGEIYEDQNGDRWIVVSLCHEPTVSMHLIEPISMDGSDCAPPLRKGGGVSGFMWQGFKKVLDAPKR